MKRHRPKLDPALLLDAIESYKNGSSLNYIEKTFGIERHKMSRLLDAQKVERRNAGFYVKFQTYSPEQRASTGKRLSALNKGRIPVNKLPLVQAIRNNMISNAKKRGLDYDLSEEDLKKVLFNNCHYCDEPPTRKMRYHENKLFSGLDRLNSDLG